MLGGPKMGPRRHGAARLLGLGMPCLQGPWSCCQRCTLPVTYRFKCQDSPVCALPPLRTCLQLKILYHRVKVVVAPLLSGAGVKGKVGCWRWGWGRGSAVTAACPLQLVCLGLSCLDLLRWHPGFANFPGSLGAGHVRLHPRCLLACQPQTRAHPMPTFPNCRR